MENSDGFKHHQKKGGGGTKTVACTSVCIDIEYNEWNDQALHESLAPGD